jgi:ketosteroid isomerase-like protein
MRLATLFLAAACCAAAADTADEKQVAAVVQKLFDAMTAKDADAVRRTMNADAQILLVQNGRLLPVMTREDFAQRVAQAKSRIVERTWEPKIEVRGRIAMFWAEYDLHADGKFNHCGIDAFLLLKTDDGWKIANGESTAETEGCKASPLGPLREK